MKDSRKKKFLKRRDEGKIEYWVDRSYDGIEPILDPKDQFDKELRERRVAEDWARSCRKLAIGHVSEIRTGSNPPDIECVFNGKPATVEITEILDPQARVAAKTAFKQDQAHPYQGFWSAEDFAHKLEKRISSKAEKYSAERQFDYLLIFTQELWLTFEEVQRWLLNHKAPNQEAFAHIHLLLDYDPKHGCHPLVCLT
ncbi:hypothetical protein [Roseivivax marinus]|uniref:hypothetical protein n=1 Tax=Roseivivax marinus TaxID=1379903 RepID=UPI00103CECFD|nr:hypothetical protein [Roseivivax marinus]